MFLPIGPPGPAHEEAYLKTNKKQEGEEEQEEEEEEEDEEG